MKISLHFLTYVLLSCLTLLVAISVDLADVSDEHIYEYICTLFGIRNNHASDDIKTGIFIQNLNHFNRTDYRKTFQQFYYFNDKYYDHSNPVVLVVVAAMDEIEMDSNFLKDEMYVELAKRSQALMLTLEPRFYGKSTPFNDLSIDNLLYLNVEQTLADLALFIKEIPEILKMDHQIDIPRKTIWVMTGKEYGGSLASWFKLKYPHLADVVVAVGAPLLISPDYTEYFDRVERNYYQLGILKPILDTLDDIRNKIDNTKRLPWQEHKQQLDTLFQDFKMCDKLYTEEVDYMEMKKGNEGRSSSKEDDEEEDEEGEDEEEDDDEEEGSDVEVQKEKVSEIKVKKEEDGVIIDSNVELFFFALTFQLAIISQAIDPPFRDFRNKAMAILNDDKLDNYDKLKNAVQFAVSYTQKKCLETDYRKNVDLLRNTDLQNVQEKTFLPEIIRNAFGTRNRFFQRCLELGRFETANEKNAFHQYAPLQIYSKVCSDVFDLGEDIENAEAAIYFTNIFYGSLNYGARKGLFISRKEDPIISMEIRESRYDEEIVAIIMERVPVGFQCATEEDKSILKAYYFRIFKTLLKWVGKYNEGSDETEIDDIYQDYEGQEIIMSEIERKIYVDERNKEETDKKKAAQEAKIAKNIHQGNAHDHDKVGDDGKTIQNLTKSIGATTGESS